MMQIDPRRAGLQQRRYVARHRIGGFVADHHAGIGRHRHIDGDLAQELAVAVEHLDAPVAAVGDIDIALGVGADAVRRAELARLAAAVAPGLHPVAVLVDLGDARIDVAVADIGVARRVPGHVGRLTEAAILRRQRRIRMLPRAGILVGRLLSCAPTPSSRGRRD